MRHLSDWFAPIGLTATIVGVGLMLAGLGSYLVAPLLLVVGLLCALLWIFTHIPQLRSLFGLRSTQSNLNAIVSVLAVAVILIAVNVIATRFPFQFDFTETKLYTLAPQTKEIVSGLDSPIQVTVFSQSPQPEIRSRLEQLRQLNSEQFSFEFVDPDRNPTLARDLDLQARDSIVVAAGDRQEQFPIPSPLTLERVLTPTLVQLTNQEQRTIYFVQGHGELALDPQPNAATLSQAIAALAEDGFSTSPLNLIETEMVPQDASAVVVAAPEVAWLPAEVERLQAYLDGGGSLLLLIDPIANPELNDLYEDWGLQPSEDVVVDVSQVSRALQQGPYISLVTRYGDHPITTPLADKGLASFFPLARSLSARDGVEATALLITSDRSWGESDLNSSNLAFDPDRDRQGPLTLGLAFTRPIQTATPSSQPGGGEPPLAESSQESPPAAPPDTELTEESLTPNDGEGAAVEPEDSAEGAAEARLVAIGNAQFAADGNFGQLGNSDLFLNALNWLTNRSESTTIRPKSPTNRRFNFTPAGLQGLRLLSAIVLPALALAMGAGLWWNRR